MSTPGRVSTFYSYKGGVGRTFLLANVAWLLARWGKRVLCVDFDLEAPGIKQYFSPNAAPAQGGVVDLLESCGQGQVPDCLPWLETIPGPWRPPGCLHLLGTGNTRDERYISRVQSLRIEDLSRNGLNARLEDVRAKWVADYDHVLVDSRTGITDIGGICAAQLPDLLILVFNATHQSFEGALRVEKLAREVRETLPLDRGRFRVLPVPCRITVGLESELEAWWERRFVNEAGPLLRPWLPEDTDLSPLFSQLRVRWQARWSYGEELPVREERLDDKDAISWSIANVAALVETRLLGAPAIAESGVLEGSELPRSRGALLSKLAGTVGLDSPSGYGHGNLVWGRNLDLPRKLQNLAITLKKQGDFVGARRQYELSLVEFDRILGPEHPEAAAARFNLLLLLRQVEPDAATPHLEMLASLSKRAEDQLSAGERYILATISPWIRNTPMAIDIHRSRPATPTSAPLPDPVATPARPGTVQK